MTAGEKSFPWPRMMQLGLGVLRLSPREFWATTPREIAAAFPMSQNMAMARSDLETLINHFPDVP